MEFRPGVRIESSDQMAELAAAALFVEVLWRIGRLRAPAPA
ncbi:MAG TPA: hypothetical protein VE684_04160 [Crenalkalicoccus sp.]|nr:hypothetical protein [Crenalkalicoccus sp.]